MFDFYYLKQTISKLDQVIDIFILSYTFKLKAHSNRSNMLVKHYPTLLGGAEQCWIVLVAGVFKQIQHHP